MNEVRSIDAVLENKFMSASILHTFISIKGNTNFLLPYLILPLILNVNFSPALSGRVSSKITTYIDRLTKKNGNTFYIEYHENINHLLHNTTIALDLCFELGWVTFDSNLFCLVSEMKPTITIDSNLVLLQTKKLAEICKTCSLEEFISIMKVKV